MAVFAKALTYVLLSEGGWSDNPSDPGGATMHGITLVKAKNHGITTKEALMTITPDKVAEIYAADYWRFDNIADQSIATKIMDMLVNMQSGVNGPAMKIVQIALNDVGTCPVVVDGMWGPHTEYAVNVTDSDRLMEAMCHRCAERYMGIVERNPSQSIFIKGWLRRAADVPRG